MLNSQVVAQKTQVYENVRSTMIRLFNISHRYEKIDTDMIHMNSAYEIANMDP